MGRGNRVLVGIGFMLVGVTLVACMNALGKWLLQHYPVVQVVWARFTGHFLLVLALFLPRFGLSLLRSQRPTLAFCRSAAMFLSNVLIFSAFALIPLANATAIAMVSPILVTLLAVPFLGERIGWRSILACALGMIGAMLIIRPDIGAASWANFLALGAAVLYAIYMLLNRHLSDRDSPETLVLYTALVAAIVTTAVVPFFAEPLKVLWHAGAFIALGALGALCQFLVIKAYQHAPASIVAPFHYAELIAATALGFVLFRDFPEPLTWAGITVIVAAGIYLAHRQRRTRVSRPQ